MANAAHNYNKMIKVGNLFLNGCVKAMLNGCDGLSLRVNGFDFKLALNRWVYKIDKVAPYCFLTAS